MKYSTLTFLSMILTVLFTEAQDSLPIRKLIYKISVFDRSMIKTKGYLSNLTDSTINVSPLKITFGKEPVTKNPEGEIDYKQISEMMLKRKGGAGRGAWKGAIAGILAGAVIGLISGDDPPCAPADPSYWFSGIGEGLCNGFRMTAGEKALMAGIAGGALGSAVGAVTGALVKKRFIIGGGKEKFDAMKLNVLNKAYGTRN